MYLKTMRGELGENKRCGDFYVHMQHQIQASSIFYSFSLIFSGIQYNLIYQAFYISTVISRCYIIVTLIWRQGTCSRYMQKFTKLLMFECAFVQLFVTDENIYPCISSSQGSFNQFLPKRNYNPILYAFLYSLPCYQMINSIIMFL